MNFEPSAAQRAFEARARDFATERVEPLAASIDADARFPMELVREAGALGLMGATIPATWGGAGQDYLAYVLALEAVARSSATLAVILSVNNSLVAETLYRHGSSAQQERWLRLLAAGEAVGAFALSEEQAGSDAANQLTRADADGDAYRLTGAKVWVANADVADVALVWAVTDATQGHHGISAFVVPMDSPGIGRTARADSLGVRGLGCMDLSFDAVRVGADQMLGAADQGFAIAMEALDGGRVAIAAQALGVGEAALSEAVAFARRRVAFGQPIASYQAIQFMLADMTTELEAARLLTWRAADARDGRRRSSVAAAMAKLAASEAGHMAADTAMQILASEGYRRGSRVERFLRDVRAAGIYQGTSEVQRLIIADGVVDSSWT